jgi:hypothetical protein
MFKMPKKCVKYSIILCLFLCIILIKNKNNIENYLNMKTNTNYDAEGEGNVIYLDRHIVSCKGNISNFKMNRKDGKYRYDYSCRNPDMNQKLVITSKKKTKEVKPELSSKNLLNAEIKCADPKDKAVGLVGFRYNNKGYYDYTCGKVVDKTEEELKKEKDEAANQEKARIQFEKEMKASLPKEQGCYIMATQTTGEKCKDFAGKWSEDSYGYKHKGTFNNKEKCLARPKDFETYCGEGHTFRSEYVGSYHTKPYNNDWKHGDKKGSFRRTYYLDGHNVSCGKDRFIKNFKLKDLGKEYTYLFKCNDPESKVITGGNITFDNDDTVATGPITGGNITFDNDDTVATGPIRAPVGKRMLVLYKPASDVPGTHHINISKVELYKPNGEKIKLTPHKVSDADVHKDKNEQDAINELYKTLDGKDETYFHSGFKDYHKFINPGKYHNSEPRYISYTFPDNVSLNKLSILTRTSPKQNQDHNNGYAKRFQGMRATIYPHVEYDIGKLKDPHIGFLFNKWFDSLRNNHGVGVEISPK